MNLDMVKKPPRVVLDTNILVSALIFGGKPQLIFDLSFEKKIIAVISPVLKAELIEVLVKKFNFQPERIKQLDRIIEKHFKFVYPLEAVNIIKDEDDNRVIEAAIEGRCQFIITGDRDLLSLEEFRQIKILTADEFLSKMEQ